MIQGIDDFAGHDAAAEPQVTRNRISPTGHGFLAWVKRRLNSISLFTMFALPWVVMFGETWAVVHAVVPKDPSVWWILIATVLTCGLPTILMLGIALMARRSLNSRFIFEAAHGERLSWLSEPGSDRAVLTAATCEKAGRLWSYEAAQTERFRGRFLFYASVYGFISSGTLLACAYVSMQAITQLNFSDMSPGAVAVAVAIAVAFGKDFGRMLVRTSIRDTSTSMLAWASRRLLIVIIATVVLVAAALTGSDTLKKLLESAYGSALLGASVAFLGDRITDAVTDRAAKVLGVTIAKRTGEGLDTIWGLEEDDTRRLADEGIDSVHALALCTTPKLFFNTPYSLRRICDWQDQALLITRVGLSRARLFREQLMIGGAIDAQLLARRLLSSSVEESQKKQFLTVLGFGTEAQASLALQRLADDEAISQLAAFKSASPWETEAEE